LDDDVIELPDPSPGPVPHEAGFAGSDGAATAPVYLGGTQIITFFSTKGGTGRTTLATEVAALLAMKGRYRERAGADPEPLRVALIDFDLASANVSARVGLAQPTMLDYLCDSSAKSPDPLEFLVRHPVSNLDLLLGPSKCLSGDRAELMGVPQAAHIVSSFKGAGYHFLILDMAAALGDLETYLLEAASRIYCVVTPTAGSVQSLYRGVEALRRIGLGGKLHYVANKMRDGINLNEAMGDLNGSLAASIPYDVLFDTAENQHVPLVLRHGGGATASLLDLATSIYPALHEPRTRHEGLRPAGWFGRRRRVG
jgi:pilus assembly protein CpaE